VKDPLRTERSAFLDASAAALDALLDLAGLEFEHPGSQEEARALLNVLQLVADTETDALAALDRLLLRCAELSVDPERRASVQRGRIHLAESLGVALARVERAERLVRTLSDA
jgi:hypothetical protein